MAEAKRSIAIPRHERRDVSERFIFAAVAAMLGLLVVCALGTFWLYPQSRLNRTLKLPFGPFPEPALQVDPAADMNAFYARELHILNSRGWVDEKAGIARMPIEEAMRKVASEGIPGWPR